MKIGVVIPVVSQFELAFKCIESVRSEYSWQPYIIPQWRERLALAKAWNVGIDWAFSDGCEYVMVINDDTVCSPWTIDGQVHLHQMLREEGLVLTSGWQVDGPPERMYTLEKPETQMAFPTNLNFSCFMINKDTIHLVGYFDERFYPAYFEDNDFHRRILLLGLKGHVCLQAPFFHYGSATQQSQHGVDHHQFEQCQQYYIEKWGGGPGGEVFSHPYNNSSLSPKEWIKHD